MLARSLECSHDLVKQVHLLHQQRTKCLLWAALSMFMAQRLWHWEVKTGPSSLLAIKLRSSFLWICKLHPWLLVHCTGFALAFFSYNCFIIQHWELGLYAAHSCLPHSFPAHQFDPRCQRERLYSLQHPSSSTVQSTWAFAAETDRSESRKQRL